MIEYSLAKMVVHVRYPEPVRDAISHIGRLCSSRVRVFRSSKERSREEEHDLLEPFDSRLLSSIPSRISLVCLSHQLEVFYSLINDLGVLGG